MPSYAFLDLKILGERVTRKVQCCEDTTPSFVTLLWIGSIVAGLIGALAGVGGGGVMVPLLIFGFGVDIHSAMGASLISVIATSSGTADEPGAFACPGSGAWRLPHDLDLCRRALSIRSLPGVPKVFQKSMKLMLKGISF